MNFLIYSFFYYSCIIDGDGVTGFILVILSSAFDFWVTKNLTGRQNYNFFHFFPSKTLFF